ncbi:hypothetical protein [Streptomyces sp. NPDC057280]|uniref:hypothetical protein n=1 Tax=Streptomyces sp. NPDC057280 TaxID=3346081 RepID=UPI00364488F1
MGLFAVLFGVVGIGVVIATGDPRALLLVLVALFPGATVLGLWQGNSGARFVATVFFGVIPGLLLLVMPRSSRAWFNPLFYDDWDELDDETAD